MYLAVIVAVTLLSFSSSTKTGAKVAFKAVLEYSKSISANQVVVYTYVTINEGKGYNPNTGIFTAPRGGLYVFHIYAMTHDNKNACLRLYQKDTIITTVYLRDGNLHDNAANSVIVKVNKGDTFYVKTQIASYLHSSNYDHYTSFSGFLI